MVSLHFSGLSAASASLRLTLPDFNRCSPTLRYYSPYHDAEEAYPSYNP